MSRLETEPLPLLSVSRAVPVATVQSQPQNTLGAGRPRPLRASVIPLPSPTGVEDSSARMPHFGFPRAALEVAVPAGPGRGQCSPVEKATGGLAAARCGGLVPKEGTYAFAKRMEANLKTWHVRACLFRCSNPTRSPADPASQRCGTLS